MNSESDQKPKAGLELINSFFEQLSKEKEKYPSPAIVDCITNLHKNGKLTKSNIINALEKIRNKNAIK